MTACLGIDVGIRNLSYCILQREENNTFRIPEWRLVDVLQLCGMADVSCDKLTSNEIHDIASFALPKIFSVNSLQLHNIAHVSIEQQPHGKYGNQKIILFSHLIFEYFRSRLLNQSIGDKLETVFFTGAAKKYEKKWLVEHRLPKPTNYAQRKQTSVKLCDLLCKNMGLSLSPIGAKRDDLADAFLLALIGWDRVT